MIRFFSVLLFVFVVMVSCGPAREQQTVESYLPDDTALLRPSQVLKLYDVDFTHLSPSANQLEKAEEYTDLSEEIEKEDMAKAIYYQTKAITYHPTLERYARLAKLYEDKQDFCNSTIAYQVLFKHFPDASEDMLYNLLYCSLKGDCNENLYYINSIAYSKHLKVEELLARAESDPRLAAAVSMKKYNQKRRTLLQYNECGDTITFTQYLSYFDPAVFPYSISEKNLGFSAKEVNAGYDCDINVDTFLTKDITNWTKYEMLVTLRRSGSGITVLYEGDSSDYEDRADLKNTFFKIVSYSNTGKILCDTTVAWRVGTTERHCTISEDLVVKINDFERVFKREYDQKDKENELLEMKPTTSSSFRIDPSTGCFMPMP